MPYKMRPFNKEDWRMFPEVEDNEDHQPYIREGEDWIGVSDLTGLGISFREGNGYDLFFFHTNNYEMAKLMLDALPDTVTKRQLLDLGFQQF